MFFVVDAAIDHGDLEARVPAQHLGIVVDLHRELARRREDQRADRVALRPGMAGRSAALEQRDQERRGLAGAGLRLACNILARQRNRQCLAWIGVER